MRDDLVACPVLQKNAAGPCRSDVADWIDAPEISSHSGAKRRGRVRNERGHRVGAGRQQDKRPDVRIRRSDERARLRTGTPSQVADPPWVDHTERPQDIDGPPNRDDVAHLGIWTCVRTATGPEPAGVGGLDVEGSVIVSATTLRAASHSASVSNSPRSPPDPWTATTAGRRRLPGGRRRYPSIFTPSLTNETL